MNTNSVNSDSDGTPDLIQLNESVLSVGGVTNDPTTDYDITITKGGYYQVSISAIMYASADDVQGEVYLEVDGTPINIDNSDDLYHEGTDLMSHEATFFYEFSDGDVLTLKVHRTTASGTMNADEASLEIIKIIGY